MSKQEHTRTHTHARKNTSTQKLSLSHTHTPKTRNTHTRTRANKQNTRTNSNKKAYKTKTCITRWATHYYLHPVCNGASPYWPRGKNPPPTDLTRPVGQARSLSPQYSREAVRAFLSVLMAMPRPKRKAESSMTQRSRVCVCVRVRDNKTAINYRVDSVVEHVDLWADSRNRCHHEG